MRWFQPLTQLSNLVLEEGLEPPRLAAPGLKPGASANFAIRAMLVRVEGLEPTDDWA